MVKTFEMVRNFDESKISGTGLCAVGCVFDNGVTVIQWAKEIKSLEIFNTFEQFMTIHCHSHPKNLTEIVWK